MGCFVWGSVYNLYLLSVLVYCALHSLYCTGQIAAVPMILLWLLYQEWYIYSISTASANILISGCGNGFFILMIMPIITDISGIYGKIITSPGLHHYNYHCNSPVPVSSVGRPPLSPADGAPCVSQCVSAIGAGANTRAVSLTDKHHRVALPARMCNKVIALFLLSLNSEFLYVQPQRYEHQERPVFDEHLPSNVTVQQGDTAYLHCRIFNAENM